MFKTNQIEKLIKYTLLTGYVEGDVPTSLMLIAPPEHAKTSIIRGIQCKNILESSDISPKAMADSVIPKMKEQEIHHLIVPDLVKPLSHKPATVDATVAMLNAGLEEGIERQDFYGQQFNFPEPYRFGMITSVTDEFFVRFFKRWNDIGFITRFIPVSYKYSDSTIAEIHDLIKRNELLTVYNGKENIQDKMKKKYKDSKKKIVVNIPPNEASFLALQSQAIAKNISSYKVETFSQGGHKSYVSPNLIGFRLQRQLRMLISAIALSNNRTTVNYTDLEEFQKLMEFIAFPNSRPVI